MKICRYPRKKLLVILRYIDKIWQTSLRSVRHIMPELVEVVPNETDGSTCVEARCLVESPAFGIGSMRLESIVRCCGVWRKNVSHILGIALNRMLWKSSLENLLPKTKRPLRQPKAIRSSHSSWGASNQKVNEGSQCHTMTLRWVCLQTKNHKSVCCWSPSRMRRKSESYPRKTWSKLHWTWRGRNFIHLKTNYDQLRNKKNSLPVTFDCLRLCSSQGTRQCSHRRSGSGLPSFG